jgi:hypothetical protein
LIKILLPIFQKRKITEARLLEIQPSSPALLPSLREGRKSLISSKTLLRNTIPALYRARERADRWVRVEFYDIKGEIPS